MIEKTTENSDIIPKAQPSQVNRRMEPQVGVPFLNHHTIILSLETFLVGTVEREGEEKVGTVFPNSAEHFTFF